MADVFISYHEDSAGEFAEQIADALESAGISCWYAKRDLPLGSDFAREIPSQIDACKVFLLVLNESAYKSKHIESEVGLAFSRWNNDEEITILPLEIGNFKRKSWLRYYLIHTQSMRAPVLDAERLRELARKVAKLLNREPTPPKAELQLPKPSKPQPIMPAAPPKVIPQPSEPVPQAPPPAKPEIQYFRVINQTFTDSQSIYLQMSSTRTELWGAPLSNNPQIYFISPALSHSKNNETFGVIPTNVLYNGDIEVCFDMPKARPRGMDLYVTVVKLALIQQTGNNQYVLIDRGKLHVMWG